MSEAPKLPQQNDGGKFMVDLTTVDSVMIDGSWITIQPGSFAVGYPVFCIPTSRVTSGAVWSYGEGFHPLSYFFTTENGRQRTGPYHHVQQMVHRTVPETEEESSPPTPELTPLPASTWAKIADFAKDLPPVQKVEIIEAMGFTRRGNVHDRSCVSLQGSGLICTCVQPESAWDNPEDVVAFLGETHKERKKITRERICKQDEFAARWEARYPDPS